MCTRNAPVSCIEFRGLSLSRTDSEPVFCQAVFRVCWPVCKQLRRFVHCHRFVCQPVCAMVDSNAVPSSHCTAAPSPSQASSTTSDLRVWPSAAAGPSSSGSSR
eukprot:953876-Rhodomonas_salina.1